MHSLSTPTLNIKMAFGRRVRVSIFVWLCVLLLSHTSKGLTYEELVMGVVDEVTQIRKDPVIPQHVRDSGNVTVSQTINGVVSFVFKGLPNHGTMMTNPNRAEEQNFEVHLHENPTLNDQETCLNGGPIGWTIYGVALYNPFNVFGTNAVEGDEAEVFDSCQGHPDMFGSYHYHQLPDACVFPGVDTNVHGIALDGFPIYGPYKEDGTRVQESELDKCHGRCGDDGKYRYHMTKTYPYILGCFRGTPVEFTQDGMIGGDYGQPPLGGEGDGQRPPPPGGDGGDDGQRPPPPGGDGGGGGFQPPDMEGSPNKCAYNLEEGPNYEFQICSVKPTEGSGNGSGHPPAAVLLIASSYLLTWIC